MGQKWEICVGGQNIFGEGLPRGDTVLSPVYKKGKK